MATFPHRLPNGRTLITVQNSNRIAEADAQGKIVQELKDLPCRPFRVVRR
jgi:hypothetical protein